VKTVPVSLVNQVFLCVLSLCFALTGKSVAQNQFYVSAAGSDSNDGSQARPWRTIQHADSVLTLGASGAVVHVASGTYSGPITTNKSGTASARIVFISDRKWGAKIATSNWSATGSFVDVNGFDMTSPATGNNYAIGTGSARSVHILNNYMHDFNVGGCGSYGVVNLGTGNGTDGTDNWLIGNVIRHAGNYSSGVNNCTTLQGVYAFGIRDIIQNNIISGITGWGIKKNMVPGGCSSNVISNNIIFNNGGGMDLTELTDSGFACAFDYNTISNNIIVNNGIDAPNGGRFGINFYHVTGTHNLVTNNLIYGNLPTNYAHHDVTCTGGTPISGSDADGTAGGCPSTNPKSDASTSITFTNFQLDTNTSPASSYDASNYQIKGGSSAIQNGTTTCAPSPGLSPCVPSTDFIGVPRLAESTALDIGSYEQSSVASSPAAPTGLSALVQ
jgi:hypothetical protein